MNFLDNDIEANHEKQRAYSMGHIVHSIYFMLISKHLRHCFSWYCSFRMPLGVKYKFINLLGET